MRLLDESELRWVSGGTFSGLDEPDRPGSQPPRDPDEPEPGPPRQEEPPRGKVDTYPERICDTGKVDSFKMRIVDPGKEGALGKVGPVSGIEAAQGESVMEIEVKCNSKKKEEEDDD